MEFNILTQKIIAMQTFFFLTVFFVYLLTLISIVAYQVIKKRAKQKRLETMLKNFKDKEYEIVTFDKDGYPIVVKYNGEYVIFR